ncbi:hypothetical protein D3C80_1829450 [compost metagenome]
MEGLDGKLYRLSNFYYRWPYLANPLLRLHLRHGKERLMMESGGVSDDYSREKECGQHGAEPAGVAPCKERLRI